MAKYRSALPQLAGDFFMTDGGIETTLIFLEGQELPLFAAFPLLETAEGEGVAAQILRDVRGARQEVRHRPHPRSRRRGGRARTGAGSSATARTRSRKRTRRPSACSRRFATTYETPATPIVISGCIGPRGDGYVVDSAMSGKEAEDYHRAQVETFAGSAADLVTAITMNYVEEAVGVAQAAKQRTCPSSSPSRSRPTGGSRRDRPWVTRSSRSTTPRRAIPPTT